MTTQAKMYLDVKDVGPTRTFMRTDEIRRNIKTRRIERAYIDLADGTIRFWEPIPDFDPDE